ncbi:glutathione S-transferase family protein [Nannocystaceae bacterium ST9]
MGEPLFDDRGRVLASAHHRLIEDLVSPYSAKLRAYLHFKRIPHRRVRIDFELYMQTIPRLVGFPIMPVLLHADGRVMQDTTPILEWFEQTHTDDQHPAALPDDPRMAMLAWLLDDVADEYLPRLIMHGRWGSEHSRTTLAHRIARRMSHSTPQTDHRPLAAMVLARQTGFDAHLGIDSNARADLDAQIVELLGLLERHLSRHRFLLGDRPSVADFAWYGPLWAHLWMDPDSTRVMEVHGRHTCDWLDTITEIGDVRGGIADELELGPWLEFAELPESLVDLLRFAAATWLPNGLACARASVERSKRYAVEIRGLTSEWSTHHYRAWSFEQVQRRLLALADPARAELDEVLRSAGLLPGLLDQGVLANGLYEGLTPPFVVDGIGDARVARRRLDRARSSEP